MRVALDGSFLRAGRGGDETFLLGLLEGLALCRGPDDSFPLLLSTAAGHGDPARAAGSTPPVAPTAVRDDPAFPVVAVGSHAGPLHFATTLPRALHRLQRRRPLDLAVSVTHAPLTGPTPSALVLGDLSFEHRPRDYPRATALRLRVLVPRHARRARAVLVPSEYTRQDVVATYGLDPARVHVVPNRVLPPARPDPDVVDRTLARLALRGVRAPYLLYVGNLHPRKNVPRLIGAFRAARRTDTRLADHRLVIAGAPWFRGRDEEAMAAGDPDVVLLGRVAEPDRVALLAGAEALAYVSLFEGFGLPPVEAMSYGVPVLTSSTTSLPEVCGAAALLVDPTDDDAITHGVHRILTDDDLRGRLRAGGPDRAAAFDAGRVGAAALAAFHATISGTDRCRPVTGQ